MSECAATTMRDLLPEYLHSRLGVEERAQVAAHLAECEECPLELAMLTSVREAMRQRTPAIDTAAIVRALPRPRRRRAVRPWILQLVAQEFADTVVVRGGAIGQLFPHAVPDIAIALEQVAPFGFEAAVQFHQLPHLLLVQPDAITHDLGEALLEALLHCLAIARKRPPLHLRPGIHRERHSEQRADNGQSNILHTCLPHPARARNFLG